MSIATHCCLHCPTLSHRFFFTASTCLQDCSIHQHGSCTALCKSHCPPHKITPVMGSSPNHTYDGLLPASSCTHNRHFNPPPPAPFSPVMGCSQLSICSLLRPFSASTPHLQQQQQKAAATAAGASAAAGSVLCEAAALRSMHLTQKQQTQ